MPRMEGNAVVLPLFTLVAMAVGGWYSVGWPLGAPLTLAVAAVAGYEVRGSVGCRRRPRGPRWGWSGPEPGSNQATPTASPQPAPAIVRTPELVPVDELPGCDFCKLEGISTPATYDGATGTFFGPWAFMCVPHFAEHGVGLRDGFGGYRMVLAS